MQGQNTSKRFYIQLYASDDRCWDDGIGFYVASDEIDRIDQIDCYVEYLPWKQHLIKHFILKYCIQHLRLI